MRVLLLSAVALFSVACGGSPVEKAEKLQEKACACADTACARDAIRELNKLSLSDEVKKLDGDQRAAFKKASLAAADCQMALKQNK